MYLFVFLTAVLLGVTHCCNIQKRGVSDAAKKAILSKHNEIRAKVANGKQGNLPQAANMLEIIWDDAIAQKAQDWANKCILQHDTAMDRDTGRGYTGQNIAIARNKDENPNWEGIIQLFYDEVSNFDARTIDKYAFDERTGHFTQIIWAETSKIGCGYVRYADGENYVHLYGCNYLPGGNFISQSIYVTGEPCTKCGRCGTIPGLCVAPVSKTSDDEPEYGEIDNEDEDKD